MKEEVKREGLATSVIFLGRRSRDELSFYYSAADCFWLLSNYDECLPLVYLEAQSCGIPAIGRKKGGTQETIQDRRTGFLVKSDEECLEILLNREYRYIEKDALRDFSASFDKIQAAQSLIS
ncbi:glycosyltransferase [Parabacteroides goldsteinii]|uniref:glycosyltransferase n=1 Tax=Parabacteroides goldsteinii TaxID=328812 RepID=UPI0025709E1C|nr:glycosyltransferase [Parabacteroides goldsteinii]